MVSPTAVTEAIVLYKLKMMYPQQAECSASPVPSDKGVQISPRSVSRRKPEELQGADDDLNVQYKRSSVMP